MQLGEVLRQRQVRTSADRLWEHVSHRLLLPKTLAFVSLALADVENFSETHV